jgi:DivIVA domain-containing protein
MDWQDIDRIRDPGFTIARRGYDRHEVDRFLEGLATWLETDAPSEIGQLAVTRKLELVGRSTAHILLTTEQESEQMRRRAQQEAAELRAEAEAAAAQTRRNADEHARRVREKADEDARRTRDAAATRAAKMIEEAEARRERIEEVIAELTARRDDVLRDMERLHGELGATVAKHRDKGAPRATRRRAGDGGGRAAGEAPKAPAEPEPRLAAESAQAAG